MSLPDKRFVCHVGAHVTGARQVQRYLRDNVDQLERQGLHCVPRALMGKLVGWGPKLVADPDRFAQELGSAWRSPGIDGVLVSHENTIGRPFGDGGGGLYAGALPTLEALAGVSEPAQRTVVLSVRPQADFLESYYLQTISEGAWHTFDDWLGALDLDDISWMPLHEQLIATFGVDAVRVLDFAEVGSDPVAHVREFFRLIGVDLPADLHVSPVHHPRPSEKGMRMVLAANPYVRTTDERMGLRAFLQKNFSDRDYPSPTLLTVEQRAELNDRYGDEYRRLVAAQPVGEARP
ncbi:hypothetical protein [Nocardioides sp.]|uniref:hypothetical protein n=1 Tax=Nocardioides sp. TaxID=35761 RepID=UPI002F428E75